MSKTTLRHLEYFCRSINRSTLATAPFGVQVQRVENGKIGLYRQSRKVSSERQRLFTGTVRDVDVYLIATQNMCWLLHDLHFVPEGGDNCDSEVVCDALP